MPVGEYGSRSAGRQQRRSGIVSPTGTRPERSPSAGCGGFNPRPSQGPERSPFAGCGMLIQIPVRNIGQDLLLPVVNNAGRGLHPRPERSTPAKYLLKLSNARNAPPRQISTYASEFGKFSPAQPFPFPSPLQCSCVDGSFRSGVQPPTGTRTTGIPQPAQGRPAFLNRHKDGRHSATGAG